MVHPYTGKTISEMFFSLPENTLKKVLPLGVTDKSIVRLGEKTLIMGILNVTPDSFTDGGNSFSLFSQKNTSYQKNL